MKAPYVTSNLILPPVSCLLQSKAFAGADYTGKTRKSSVSHKQLLAAPSLIPAALLLLIQE